MVIKVVVYGPKRPHPSVLSGIVKEDKLAVSTKLPFVFVLIVPMRIQSGESINIPFAAGYMMSVNLIFGLPYLQSTGSIVDLNDNVVAVSKVGHTHFPIKYCVTQCSVPSITSIKMQHARDTRYKGIHTELHEIEAQVQCVSAATISDPTTKSSPYVQPTKVSKIGIQTRF